MVVVVGDDDDDDGGDNATVVVVVDDVDGGGGRINGPSIIPITLCSDMYTARDPARSVATMADRIANPFRIPSRDNMVKLVMW